MANQMRRGNSNGHPRGAKAGTVVRKYAPTGLFGPRGSGIVARGMPHRMESMGEAKDRRVG